MPPIREAAAVPALRRIARAALLAVLCASAGCVWLDRPPPAVLEDRCSECGEAEACDHGECKSYCNEDSGYPSLYAPCVSPARVCLYGDCAVPCADYDCAGGFTCDPILNECRDYCFDDGDCQRNYHCCEGFGADCDYGTCVRG